MRVFVTGATGFIGQAVVQELLDAGHKVIGLARSEESATALQAKGVDVIRGSLEDIESLKRGAREADGVINLAFNHDFTKYEENTNTEYAAIQAIGATLVGTNKPFVITMGTLILPKGKLGVEESVIDYDDAMNVRAKSEKEVDILAAQGVRASVVRLSPTVHGPGDLAFINMLAQIARGNGEAAYIGNGLNRWPAVHRLDAARLFRLAVEKGVAGGRYHAAAEEGIPFKNIAEALGQSLGLPVVSKTPEEAPAYFRGFIAALAGVDNPTSSKKTQETLGWKPSESTLLEDIKSGLYNDAKSTSLSV
jgi:nucleoside-diphosphate-sugar epimerase